MNYEDILNSDYFKETYSKIEKIKKDYPVNHGFTHIQNVIKNALRIAEVFGLNNKEKELLLIACTLHDIGYIDSRDNHALNGAILAREYLKNNKFSNEDINVICDAIRNHGGKKAEDFIDVISMCLVIADKLDFVSSRYNKSMLEYPKRAIFPNILDTLIELSDNNMILKIIVNNEFSVSLFEEQNYFVKLNDFMKLLAKKLDTSYKIKYSICMHQNCIE